MKEPRRGSTEHPHRRGHCPAATARVLGFGSHPPLFRLRNADLRNDGASLSIGPPIRSARRVLQIRRNLVTTSRRDDANRARPGGRAWRARRSYPRLLLASLPAVGLRPRARRGNLGLFRRVIRPRHYESDARYPLSVSKKLGQGSRTVAAARTD